MKSCVLGFDLSLSAPAAVVLPHGWTPGDWKRVKTWLLKTKDPKNSADTRGQYDRYLQIVNWAQEIAKGVGAPQRYFIEQYAFSRNNSQASKLMELGGAVRVRLYEKLGMIATIVSSSSAREILLATVPQKDQKIAVQLALFNRGGAPKTWEENISDAFVVANFGLTELGGTALSLATKAEMKAAAAKRKR